MNNKVSRILGLAFLLQVITSYSSGLFFRPLWFVADDIGATMSKIAENPNLFRAHILVDSLTVLGVVFLGGVLFDTLKNQNKKLDLTALGFYILEGAMLAGSRIASFSLRPSGHRSCKGERWSLRVMVPNERWSSNRQMALLLPLPSSGSII